MTDWSFLDAAYVISLDTATNRHHTSQEELHRVNLLPLTKYYYATRHPNSGKQGCYESHTAVLQQAAAAQPTKPVLILEDDVQFTRDWQKHLGHAVKFITHAPPNTWDIFLLGYLPIKTTRVNKHIQRVQCGALSHAMIYHPDTLRRLNSWLPTYDGKHFDYAILCNQCSWQKLFQPHQTCMTAPNELKLKVYALAPIIAMQRHDNTSTAAMSTKFVTRTLANTRIMRILATTANNVSLPTFLTYFTVIISILLVGMLVTVIVVPIVMTRKKT